MIHHDTPANAKHLGNEGIAFSKISLPGTVAASDFYAQEMQTAAEDAAGDLEREIRQEIDAVRNDKLQELCTSAGASVLAVFSVLAVRQVPRRAGSLVPGDEVNQEGGPSRWVRHQYIEKLLSKLVPKIEKEMQSRQGGGRRQGHFFSYQVRIM